MAIDQTVHAGQFEPVIGLIELGVPPLVLGVHHTRGDAVVQIDHFANLVLIGFDPYPIPLLETKSLGVNGIHLKPRNGPQLAAPWQLPVLGMEVGSLTTPGGHQERVVVREQIGVGDGAMRSLHEFRELLALAGQP